MKSLPLADPKTLKSFVRYLTANGSRVDRHLEAMHIDPGLVEDGNGKITKAQVYGFLNRCCEREGIDDLGYRVTEQSGLEGMEALGHATVQAATLKDAIETFGRYLSRWMGENKIWIERDPQDESIAWLCNASEDGFNLQRDFANQSGALILTEIIRLAAGPDWRPKSVRLEMHPSSAHQNVAALADAEVTFNPNVTAVAFPVELLGRPIRSGIARNGPATSLRDTPNGFISSLTIILRQHLSNRTFPTLSVAAEITGTSPRTLQRLLVDQGLSYRQLGDRIRFDTARRMLLSDRKTSLQEISEAVGYFGPNNFVRAFKRITGQTPTEYRVNDLDRRTRS